MSRTTTTLWTLCLMLLATSGAWAAGITKAETNRILFILDLVNERQIDSKATSAPDAEVVHEYVDSIAHLLERVAQLDCEAIVGVVAVEEKEVDDTLAKLLEEHLSKCPAPLIEVNIQNLGKVEGWGQTGFNPFKESTGVSEPALHIRGDIALTEGGRGEFVIATGDSGSWVESWKLKGGAEAAQFNAKDTASANAAPLKACGGGPWWPLCCSTQYSICNAIHGIPFIGPLLCSNCYSSCYLSCRYGCINNPCHSCDPCGLTWLLCRFVPGASC